MNSYLLSLLSLLQWLIPLTCCTWELFHPWKTLYHLPQGSSVPGKTVLSWTPVKILANLHWVNSFTFWAHCSGKFTVWLHLDIFSPMEDALPQTTRLLDIWKAGFAMKASQHSGHLYWIKPRTNTFWVFFSAHLWRSDPLTDFDAKWLVNDVDSRKGRAFCSKNSYFS